MSKNHFRKQPKHTLAPLRHRLSEHAQIKRKKKLEGRREGQTAFEQDMEKWLQDPEFKEVYDAATLELKENQNLELKTREDSDEQN